MNNVISSAADYATIGGGEDNTNAAGNANIGGGGNNVISSGAGYSTIGGGYENLIDTNSASSFFIPFQFFYGAWAVVGGGFQNRISSAGSFIGGGFNNWIDPGSFFTNNVSGNEYEGGFSVIGGGSGNTNSAGASFIGGGGFNWIQPNVAQWSVIGGGEGNVIDTNCFVSTLFSYGVVLNNLSGGFAVIGGGAANKIRSDTSFIGGGARNVIDLGSSVSVIGGGVGNSITNSRNCFIGGGGGNFIQPNSGSGISTYSTIAGGSGNSILAAGGGGFIGGGSGNTIDTNGAAAVIVGGSNNRANNRNATVPGGEFNVASGQDSFAAGRYAQATNDFSFVWSDSPQPAAHCTGPNQFIISAGGGVAINQNPETNDFYPGQNYALSVNNGLHVDYVEATAGVICDVGINVGGSGSFGGSISAVDGNFSGTVSAMAFNPTSDRNLKEHFTPLNPEDVLAKVAALPITRWNFKADESQRHIGPMAQDFHAAFGLNGDDDRHISVVDEGGVALAAIQGLNQKLNEKDAEIQQLKQSVAQLQALVAQLTKSQDR